MIRIVLSDRTFEYDVRSLTKAFFENEDMEVVDIDSDCDEAEFTFKVFTSDDEIKLELVSKKKDINKELIEDISRKIGNVPNELEYKAKYKNILKRLIYRLLSETLDIVLPWGTLTGIRPSKIVYEQLEKNSSDDEIRIFMKETYLADDDKIELALEIAHREKCILEDIDYKNGYSLYIGIPFCPTRCSYCSFTSYPLEKYENVVEDYIDALIKEMEYASTMIKNKILTTVYIGGGTPTTLSASQLDRIINKLKELWDFSTVREFTVEAGRPDSITRDKLQVLKDQGVTRISINPQSMRQKTLDLIGRKHTIESIVDAFNLAREVGHKNINMDLILGLPGETIEDVRFTLDEIKKLNPDNLTVHTLAIKRAAYLNI